MTANLEVEIETLKSQLQQCPKAGRGRKYPIGLRARALELLRLARSHGRSIPEFAKALSIGPGTLYAWKSELARENSEQVPAQAGNPRHALVRSVRVRSDEAPVSASRGGMTLELPGGVRVSGLGANDVIEILRGLRDR